MIEKGATVVMVVDDETDEVLMIVVTAPAEDEEVKDEKVTIGTIAAPTSKDSAVYAVTAGNGEVTVGDEFTVTINCTTAPTSGSEVVTVTYNGTEKTITFTTTGEQSVKFTAAKDATSVTAEVK